MDDPKPTLSQQERQDAKYRPSNSSFNVTINRFSWLTYKKIPSDFRTADVIIKLVCIYI